MSESVRESRPFNVLMVGVGGQGVVLASDILAEAALRAGLDVKKSEIHGMSQRGGAVFSHVRFGERVHSPMIPQGEADVLYALERMELLRWAEWARPGAVACYLAQSTLPAGVSSYPPGIDEEIDRLFGSVVRIDPRAIRDRVSPKVEAFLDAIDRLSPDGTAGVNREGFRIGRDLAGARTTAPQEATHVE